MAAVTQALASSCTGAGGRDCSKASSEAKGSFSGTAALEVAEATGEAHTDGSGELAGGAARLPWLAGTPCCSKAWHTRGLWLPPHACCGSMQKLRSGPSPPLFAPSERTLPTVVSSSEVAAEAEVCLSAGCHAAGGDPAA